MINKFLKKIFKATLYKWYLNQRGYFYYFGKKVFFPKHSSTFNLAIANGIYEQEILKFIQTFVREHSTYIDIGANIGLMSIPVLINHPSVRVISFEASPATFECLKRTWEESGEKDRWLIYNQAVNHRNEEVDFFTSTAADGAYESIKDTKRVNFSGKIKVPGTTIDKAWTDLNKPDVSFIKSDIEGADLLALQGAIGCISVCRPLILLEWNRINIQAFHFKQQDLLDFCDNHQYKCYAVPSMIAIKNQMELDLHTIITENYLLIP